jgi:thiol:disulfide interchange protein DsbA
MRMKSLFLPLLLVLPLLACAAETDQKDEPFSEGIDYELVVPPQPGGSDGTVEVKELFWYGCPHCYHFEPKVKAWLADKPDYVEFSRVPAIFTNPSWKLHAQAFYTAEVLGVLEKMHPIIFNAIHQKHQRLKSEDELAKLFAENGIPEDKFREAFNSFAVQSDVRRAADLTQRYGISGVPTMVVNGKYRVDGPIAGTYDRLIKIVNYLAKKEHEQASGQ